MKIQIEIKITIQDGPEDLRAELKSRLSFTNPKWIENDKRGYWNGKTPQVLKFYEMSHDDSLVIPRGFIKQLLSLCKRHEVQYDLEDRRRTLPEVDFSFRGELRPFQQEAVKEILERDFGTLSAPTGAGKTVIALYLIAKRKQPCLVIWR